LAQLVERRGRAGREQRGRRWGAAAELRLQMLEARAEKIERAADGGLELSRRA
jgi:hypothetical protein